MDSETKTLLLFIGAVVAAYYASAMREADKLTHKGCGCNGACGKSSCAVEFGADQVQGSDRTVLFY